MAEFPADDTTVAGAAGAEGGSGNGVLRANEVAVGRGCDAKGDARAFVIAARAAAATHVLFVVDADCALASAGGFAFETGGEPEATAALAAARASRLRSREPWPRLCFLGWDPFVVRRTGGRSFGCVR